MFQTCVVKNWSQFKTHHTSQMRTCHVRHGNRNRDWDKTPERNNNPYTYQGYLIFESKDIKIPVSLLDVRDAVDCCSDILNEQMKYACYIQFGVDGEMAEKYYKKLEKMERLYMMEQDPESSTPTEPSAPPKKKKKGIFGKWFMFGKDIDAN